MARVRLATWRPAHLQRARKARGWSVEELAERAGITPGSVRHYECGRAAPQPPTLVRLAAALDVATVDLAPLGPEPTLHELRWHAGLSGADLEASLGLSRSTLSEQLRGRAPISCVESWCAALSTPAVPVTPALLERAWKTSRPPEPNAAGAVRLPDPRTAVDDEPAGFVDLVDDEPLDKEVAEEISAALGNLAAAERQLDDVVASARERGYSWQDIGKMLGVTRQAAWQRFALRREPGEPSAE